jgi:hypothetical protein
MYYLKHKKKYFIRYIWFIISGKARTARVLNGLKNDPSDEYIGEVILK